MSLTTINKRYGNLLNLGASVVVSVVFLQILFLVVSLCQFNKARATQALPASPLNWPEEAGVPQCNWRIFEKCDVSGGVGGASPARRFRLAGTFFLHPDDNTADIRKAVLDDIKSNSQRIVGENEEMPDVGARVAQILQESVILKYSDGEEEELRLAFSQGSLSGTTSSGSQTPAALPGGDRFGGKQLGPGRWVFNRDSLMSYYKELMDNPQRLLHVFDSLKPLYDDQKRIEGYKLGIEGEADFFKSSGMKEGDIVKTVNSVPMTSRRRAENFIKQFVNGNANTFVFEVEREGKPTRLIYQIR